MLSQGRTTPPIRAKQLGIPLITETLNGITKGRESEGSFYRERTPNSSDVNLIKLT